MPLIEDYLTLPPDIALLQWLARGSLKQNLPRTLRLFCLLRYFYSNTPPFSEPFNYTTWRKTFFTPSHPEDDTIPTLHDSECRCSQTAAQWLFPTGNQDSKKKWQQQLQKHDPISDFKLEKFLETRLFACTRRTLLQDLHILSELGWLNYRKREYELVTEIPSIPTLIYSSNNNFTSESSLPFLHPDLEPIAQNHSLNSGENQRFFLNLDYIVSNKFSDQVDDLQYQLKEIWSQKIIPPIQFKYSSSKFGLTSCITYPVAIFYCQRAVYLAGFGGNPTNPEQWYNYRLDWVGEINQLNWENAKIPPLLKLRHSNQTLPTPEDILKAMSEAWGFDFYEPTKLMILRFERVFNDSYIQDTFRHETFKAISYQQVIKIIQTKAPKENQSQLLNILKKRSPEDAYYQVKYRHNDTNIGLRLRSWRPKGEVIMPLELRQQQGREAQIEAELYDD